MESSTAKLYNPKYEDTAPVAPEINLKRGAVETQEDP